MRRRPPAGRMKARARFDGPAHGVAVPPDSVPNAKLMALLRRYMMEHAKSASRSVCLCPICVDARKLLEQAFGEKGKV